MNRRSFLKLLGLSTAVLVMPISVQSETIRKKVAKAYKCKIVDSFNVKSVYHIGVGQYTVEFNNEVENSAVQCSGSTSIHSIKNNTVNIKNHSNDNKINMVAHGKKLKAWVVFKGK